MSNPTETYARVVDGKVVEYPVYRDFITNRSHPLSWYTRVDVSNYPTQIPRFHTVVESVSVVNGKCVANYTFQPLSLDSVLCLVPTDAAPDAELVKRITDLAIEAVQAKLDKFAATRGYGDSRTSPIVSVCTYAMSANARFAAEAQYCVTKRDETWAAMYALFDSVTAGARAFPKSFADIDAALPALAWPA